MGFVDNNLMKNEWVLYRAKLHWMHFSATLIFFIITVIGYKISNVIGTILLVLFIIGLVDAIISFLTSEFAVTNKRVLSKYGAIKRSSLDILLQKVESVIINQNVIGRLLNYGSVVIRGSGGTPNSFNNIADPLELRNQVQKAIDLS